MTGSVPPTPPPFGAPLPGSSQWWMGPNPADERRRALGEIRSSISVYRIAVILLLLVALIDGGYAVLTGVVVSGYFGSVSSGSATTAVSGSALGLAALGGVLGFAAFIVTLIAWWKWRGGVRRLDDPVVPYGESPWGATGAKRYYSYTVWTFIISILATIGIVIAFAAVLLTSLNVHVNPNGTVTQPTQAQIQSAIHSAFGVLIAAVVVAAVLTFLQYYFATTSLVRGARPGAPAGAVAQLEGGQRYVLIGAAVSFVAIAGFVTPYATFAAAIAPVLYLVGYTSILQGYDAVIQAPPAGSPPAAPTGPPSAPPLLPA
ncbi:MAG TPA: hypothetical protein VFF67_02515 [Thermoplasmata archaeon]|nr:hypothetical protein [Thermoplasmata archaeon]